MIKTVGVLWVFLFASIVFARSENATLYMAKVFAKTQAERTSVANVGVALDGIYSDSVVIFGTQAEINKVKKLGLKVEKTALPQRLVDDFPGGDSAFHNYAETEAALKQLITQYPNLVTPVNIGSSLEGRNLSGVRLSSNPTPDSLPTAVFFGCHHAREHLSVEVPLLMAKYLADNYTTNPRIKTLLDTREVWIVPMLNPDGAEYDVATGSYRMWRKNRRNNGGSSYGVDLNRNYGKGWGGQGSSGSTSSDTYRGPSPFSEPETQAARDFLRERNKATVLISFHTFSELVLWPWGHTNSSISNDADRTVFETIGRKMASWNGYRPQKSSDLYVASGDTTDWAYDELKIFAYTFELSPSSIFGGGFYPGASAIQPTFQANIEPILYLIDKAENPYSVLRSRTDPLSILN